VEWQTADGSVPASPSPENALVAAPSPNGRAEHVQEVTDRKDSVIIASPMVGTFYRTPEPGSAPYVSVGDAVEPGQVVGIVEAMKLMNPITAEKAGIVEEVLAENAAAVEFGQPLISLNVTAPGPTS
jgi:acetyl-CoA carboxylase biotin carboxyl carrier protein